MLRARLSDPFELCAALGLCEGPGKRERGEWWREGPGVIVRCPLHGGRSCHVIEGSDGTVGFNCYGCNETGDALDLIAAVHGFDARQNFPRVLSIAAQLAGVTLAPRGTRAPAPEPPPTPRRPPPRAEAPTLDDATFAELARVMLAACPLDSPSAEDVRRYLAGRGILDGARADGWGALPTTPAGLSDVRARIVATVGADAWTRSGLAHAQDPERWRWSSHRLVIPWRAPSGDVQTVQRRVIAPADGPRYVAPAGREPLYPYNVNALANAPSATVAIVEGAVDAVALRMACEAEGVLASIVGIPGVAAWREGWREYVRGRVVAIATDGDDAGEACARRLAPRLAPVAREVQRWRPDAGKDWCAAWQTRTNATR
jgi:DNA primase